MQHSEQINDLAAALAKAQSEIKGALKDSDNPYFKSKYADLASVWDACREPLTKNGLSVVQVPSTEFTGEPEVVTTESRSGGERTVVRVATRVSVTTRLLHASGQWLEGVVTAMLPTGDPQAVGSAITYLRRYGLQSAVGVAPEDDDAEATTRPLPATPRQAPRPFGVNENGEHVIPGKETAWAGHGGKAITDPTVPVKVLNKLQDWLMNPPGDFKADPKPLLKALEAELDKRAMNQTETAAGVTTNPGGPTLTLTSQDDFLSHRMRLTILMKGCPTLYTLADEKAMREWIDAEGRTLADVLQKVQDVEQAIEQHRGDKETGRKRSKEPAPVA